MPEANPAAPSPETPTTSAATVQVTTTKLPPGTAVVTAIADPADRVAESDEANNKSQTTVHT